MRTFLYRFVFEVTGSMEVRIGYTELICNNLSVGWLTDHLTYYRTRHFVIFEKLLEVSGYQADQHGNNSGLY